VSLTGVFDHWQAVSARDRDRVRVRHLAEEMNGDGACFGLIACASKAGSGLKLRLNINENGPRAVTDGLGVAISGWHRNHLITWMTSKPKAEP
jgi:hypothetical protein